MARVARLLNRVLRVEDVGVSEARAHGPLPVLLVGLTVVTGLVDAFSYLALGHVFVANMTGNVVFLGFGLAGVGDIQVWASLTAVGAFALGAAVGGRWGVGRTPHRGRLRLRGIHSCPTATVADVGQLLTSTIRIGS